MYCIKCGVKLADTENVCPLCQTKVYHPDLLRKEGETLYPTKKYPPKQRRFRWLQMMLSVAVLMAILIVLLCDLQVSGGIGWSGLVVGAIMVGYVGCILPTWFGNPNPVIFVPCAFAAIELYLLYINFHLDGDWFLSFAFPLSGGVGIIATAMAALLRYVRRGKLYIFGGAAISMGIFMLGLEFLANHTFQILTFVGWSFYPLIALVLLGGFLIFLAICRPARESMERKFFI